MGRELTRTSASVRTKYKTMKMVAIMKLNRIQMNVISQYSHKETQILR